jgi:nucleoside-diphosphate-sugar epimerase
LIARGKDVIGLDLSYPKDPIGVGYDRARLIVGDYRDRELVKDLLRDVDYIFHLASAHLQVNLPEAEYWSVNVHGLKAFLEAARQNGIKKFIHVSTVGVYGNLKVVPADEESACQSQSLYGETKRAGELEVIKYCTEHGLSSLILRPAWVYGPGCPRTLKIYKSLHKKLFVMIGDGQNLRHPVYIEDMLQAFRLAIQKDTANAEIFLIGGECAVTTSELVKSFCRALELPEPKIRIPYGLGIALAATSEIIFRISAKEPPFSRRSLEFFQTNNAFDISKARDIMGFKPAYGFETGLMKCKEWLRSRP